MQVELLQKLQRKIANHSIECTLRYRYVPFTSCLESYTDCSCITCNAAHTTSITCNLICTPGCSKVQNTFLCRCQSCTHVHARMGKKKKKKNTGRVHVDASTSPPTGKLGVDDSEQCTFQSSFSVSKPFLDCQVFCWTVSSDELETREEEAEEEQENSNGVCSHVRHVRPRSINPSISRLSQPTSFSSSSKVHTVHTIHTYTTHTHTPHIYIHTPHTYAHTAHTYARTAHTYTHIQV